MADSKIRWSESGEPETPPLGRCFMWFDGTDKIFKIKRDNGTVEPLGGGAGQNFTIDFFTLTDDDITNSFVTLSQDPFNETMVSLDIIGGTPQFYGTDYYVQDNKLKWDGKTLASILSTGDRLRVTYNY